MAIEVPMNSSASEKKITLEVDHPPILSLPIEASDSPVGTIGEAIKPPKYSDEQHHTWAQLYARQEPILQGYVCDEYIHGRELMQFPKDTIPELRTVSKRMKELSGWQLVRVDGMVASEYFFGFLGNKSFPATDFIRHPSELEYTPAPDMFHDLMGHVPLFTNDRFASFFYSFGLAGIKACELKQQEILDALTKIYWFTVEFGLINPTAHLGAKRDPAQARIYGAGIASSVGEITYSLSDKVKKHPFSIEAIASRPYNIHEMQTDLFEISSFEELETEFKQWASGVGVI
jgi:phenylalanine-4-hydroxylase